MRRSSFLQGGLPRFASTILFAGAGSRRRNRKRLRDIVISMRLHVSWERRLNNVYQPTLSILIGVPENCSNVRCVH